MKLMKLKSWTLRWDTVHCDPQQGPKRTVIRPILQVTSSVGPLVFRRNIVLSIAEAEDVCRFGTDAVRALVRKRATGVWERLARKVRLILIKARRRARRWLP